MATETTTRLLDDLDGGSAERSVTFAFEGKQYKLDLSKKNIASFEKALKPYIAAAEEVTASRRMSSSKGRHPRKSTGRARTDLAAVREWARANGFEVSERGRISAEVMEAYEAAAT